jgi:predicted anti-sigma-YlaC factor YlaD
VTCDRYREAASARLDGAPIGISASALEHHLAVCTDCARWLETAAAVGRSFRVSGNTPLDLSESILDQVVLPAARVTARRRALRLSLALLGFVQWALATPALFGDAAMASAAAHLGMHASHESAAWNLALGAAFLAVAVKPTRAAGTIPILATFVGVLALLSLPDLVAGAVEVARLASHAGVVLGLVLTTLLARSERLRPVPGATQTGDGTVASVRSIKRRGAA